MTSRFSTVLDQAELDQIVHRLGEEISRDHPGGVVLIGVLHFSVALMADIFRCMTVACVVDFLALSRYEEGAERIRILKDIEVDLHGKDVVVLEDIVDTGFSSRYVTELIEARGARSVSICALLDRPSRRILPIDLRYVGNVVGDDYLVGYGLSYRQRYRNLPEVIAVSIDVMDNEAPEFEKELFEQRRVSPEQLGE